MRIGFAAVAGANPAPLLLWAAPEARTGERLRLNEFCGINLAGYRLTREGRRHRWLYHDPTDAAADVVSRLADATVGIVGEHPVGFDQCAYDADDLAATLAVRADPASLPELFARAESADDVAA